MQLTQISVIQLVLLYQIKPDVWKKRSERGRHCARSGCSKVRTPPARPLQTHTNRQDRLQYTAPLASTQSKYIVAEENRMKFIKFTVRIDMISLATLQSIVWTTCQSSKKITPIPKKRTETKPVKLFFGCIGSLIRITDRWLAIVSVAVKADNLITGSRRSIEFYHTALLHRRYPVPSLIPAPSGAAQGSNLPVHSASSLHNSVLIGLTSQNKCTLITFITLYPPKNCATYFCNVFGFCWPILTILSALQSKMTRAHLWNIFAPYLTCVAALSNKILCSKYQHFF